jgi:hypothetical protein
VLGFPQGKGEVMVVDGLGNGPLGLLLPDDELVEVSYHVLWSGEKAER